MKLAKITVRKNFSTGEEIANAVTHGLGVLLGVAALVIIAIQCAKGQNVIYTVSMMIYLASTILLFANSTLYHALKGGKAKDVFEKFDHLSIYILIAGTFTPLCLIAIGGTKGIIICIIEWLLAIAGVVTKSLWIDRFVKTHVLIFLIMSWMILPFIGSAYKSIFDHGFYLLLAGGLSYSFGVIFYVFDWFKYHHFIWHVFVLSGSVLLFFSITFKI